MDWQPIIHDLILVLPATIAAVAAWRQGKKTHSLVNSMRDQEKAETKNASDTLLKSETGRARAEGINQGREGG